MSKKFVYGRFFILKFSSGIDDQTAISICKNIRKLHNLEELGLNLSG